MSLERLNPVLERDGFAIYIRGRKESGKTDFSLTLAEYCYYKGFRTKIATNIETESYIIERQITNLPDLKEWLKESKRKLFILDEAGITMPKLRFMSNINVEIMKIIQMIRHYDAGFISVAPAKRNVDSGLLDSDLLDAQIKKISKGRAIVKDEFQNATYFLEDISRTSIKFNSKHIAEFTMNKPINKNTLPICCQVAETYRSTRSLQQTSEAYKMEKEEVRRLIFKHLGHEPVTSYSQQGGVVPREESPKTLNPT